MEHGGQPLALVVTLHLVGLGGREVLVHLADDAHCLGDAGTLPVPAGPDHRQSRSRPRPAASTSIVHRFQCRPAGGISPKLFAIIVAVRLTRLPQPATSSELLRWHELRPGEGGVGGLRPGRADEVAQRVRPVAGQHVADVDHVAPAGGELPALHREELAGHHLGRQVEGAVLARLAAVVTLAVVRQQLRRPDLGVEGDVVLAHEVVRQACSPLVSFHHSRQRSGSPSAAGPLDGRRQVADDGVEPHVQALGGWSRQPSSGTGMPQSMSRVIARGRMSSRMFLENRITLGRHVPDASRSSSHSASAPARAGRSRKKCWVSTNSGVSPLIFDARVRSGRSGRAGCRSCRTGRRGPRRSRRSGRCPRCSGRAGCDRSTGLIAPYVRLLDHVAVAVHRPEHLLHHRVVVAGRRAGEQVVRQPEVDQVLRRSPRCSCRPARGR